MLLCTLGAFLLRNLITEEEEKQSEVSEAKITG